MKNDVLSFGTINFGVRSYFAVKGGFQTVRKMGSRSFYKNVTDDFVIQKNEILAINKEEKQFNAGNSSIKVLQSHFETNIIECLNKVKQ